MDGLNLNLNESAPPRVMPRIGERESAGGSATKAKRRMRWWVILITFGVTAAGGGCGYWIYTMLR